MPYKDFTAKFKEAINPTPPEQEAKGDYRQRRLAELQTTVTEEKFDEMFKAAYAGEESKYAAGIALFEPLWEQILELFFDDRSTFYENFNSFVAFCLENGWEPQVHGSRRVLVKLAMYATLIKSPPPPKYKKGLVAWFVDAVGDALRALGFDPQEIRDFIKQVITLLI